MQSRPRNQSYHGGQGAVHCPGQENHMPSCVVICGHPWLQGRLPLRGSLLCEAIGAGNERKHRATSRAMWHGRDTQGDGTDRDPPSFPSLESGIWGCGVVIAPGKHTHAWEPVAISACSHPYFHSAERAPTGVSNLNPSPHRSFSLLIICSLSLQQPEMWRPPPARHLHSRSTPLDSWKDC